jgi:cellulose biosynthesis protein BcsQ
MTKIISFVAQKGGSGKSTMTLIMANYFAYNEKKNVVVIDGDAPQHSLQKLRKSEMEDEDSINKKVLSSHVNSDVETYPIYQCVPSEDQEQPSENLYSVSKVIDALVKQGDIDNIFVDLAGTLSSP